MSDRFRFRLGRLLALREKAQDRAAVALAQSLDAAARIAQAQERAAQIAVAARQDAAAERTRPGERAALAWLSERADAGAAELGRQLTDAQRDAESRRHELLIRTRERRVLEKLRERQTEAWREDSSRRAQHQMDDVALRITTDRLQDDQP